MCMKICIISWLFHQFRLLGILSVGIPCFSLDCCCTVYWVQVAWAVAGGRWAVDGGRWTGLDSLDTGGRSSAQNPDQDPPSTDQVTRLHWKRSVRKK